MWGKAFEPWYEVEDFSTIILWIVWIVKMIVKKMPIFMNVNYATSNAVKKVIIPNI